MTETPQDFDLDAWLEDAERPARSVTVYQKAGLIADLDRLAERIENAEDEEVDGPSAGGGSLRSQYAKLAQQFHDSALTIRIQGHDENEKAEIVRAHPGIDATELGSIILAEAITSPKITPKQLRRLAKTIGEAQFNLIPTAYQKASKEVPVVSADFLPKRSTPDDGGE